MARTGRVAIAGLGFLLVACGPRVDISSLASGAVDPTTGRSVTSAEADRLETDATAAQTSADADAATQQGSTAATTGRATGRTVVPGGNGGATDVGVTATAVTVGASAAIGGALPGQFSPAIEGIRSYFNLINQQGGVYGRLLRFHSHDDALNRTTYRENVVHLIREDKVFAMTGNMSAADDGGCPDFVGDTPDIGTFAINYCRAQYRTHYSPMGSLKKGVYGGLPEWQFLKDRFGFTNPAVEYLTDFETSQDQGLAVVDALARLLGRRSRSDIYQGAHKATEPDYNSEVLTLQRRGIDAVFSSMDIASNVKLVRALCQQSTSYRPKLVHVEISTYDPSFISQLSPPDRPWEGSCLATQEVWMRSPHLAFSNPANAEMRLYLSTLRRYYPDAVATTFGIEGWLSGKFFVEALRQAGPNLTRARLYQVLNSIRDWSADGLIGPNTPSLRLVYHCNVMTRVENRDFVQKTPSFLCGNFYRSEDYTGPPIGP